MIKRFLAVSTIFAGSLSMAFAGSFYISPMVTYESIVANNNKIHYEGMSPLLSVGYGDLMNERIYLAAEVFGSPTSITIHNNNIDAGNLKITYRYGLSILPGIDLDKALIAYARLGVGVTHFDNLDLTRGSYHGGLGLETRLNDVWSARGEFVYTRFRRITDVGTPQMYQFGISVVYRFC